LLFSASLGSLGLLGDRLFLSLYSTNSQCAIRTKKKLIAEDAEMAEARREKIKA
jgi:hypothetical protein